MSTLVASLHCKRPVPLAGTLTCAAGQMVALLGPSGAGKTSWLRAIAGLLRPEIGTISLGERCWFDGERRHFTPPRARRVGFLFQNYALMPHMSARENVALPLWQLPRQQRLAEAEQWLERVGLAPELWSRRPAELSGGERQRVAMARALAGSPHVLLLDEPFSAVDALQRQLLYALLAQLRAQVAIPTVLVTHDLIEARLLADEIAVIDGGTVLQQGTTEALYRSPRNGRVAAILGIRNRFVGRWLGADPDHPGWGRLRWLPTRSAPDDATLTVLPARDKGRIPAGQLVDWVIQNDALTLIPTSAKVTAASPTQALLPVRVTAVRSSGEFSQVVVTGVSPAVAVELVAAGPQRHHWEVGVPAQLLIDTSWIHVMPVRRP